MATVGVKGLELRLGYTNRQPRTRRVRAAGL